MAGTRVRALIWDENPHHAPKELYPRSLNGAIGDGLLNVARDHIVVSLANLDDPEQGITQEALEQTDVLLWWGHARHNEVTDKTADLIADRVQNHGLGLVALHSAHYSKPFRKTIGANGHLKGGWREENPPEEEHIRVCAPWHPIAKGVEDFVLEHEEMYGAPFDVPPPLVTIFQSHYPYSGDTFPSGLCWTVGKGLDPDFTSGPGEGKGQGEGVGRVFYFRPGHESVPTFHNEIVHRILANAILWAAKKS
jgi:trehalose utilization protein